MKPTFAGMMCVCPKCESSMVLSVELIEFIISCETEMDDPFDVAIQEAIDYQSPANRIIPFADAPFPVALDLESQGLSFIGWCPKCKRPGRCVITPIELLKLLDDEESSTRGENGS